MSSCREDDDPASLVLQLLGFEPEIAWQVNVYTSIV